MADVLDEHGNPIQLTDEFGNPVQLTDEYGNPMHLTGVATTSPTDTYSFSSYDPGVTADATGGGVTTTGAAHGGVTVADVTGIHGHDQDKQQGLGEKGNEFGRSISSSSSSSEDDGQGGRRKKSLKQKIKEKLTGGKHKEDHPQAAPTAGHGVTYTASNTITSTTTIGVEHQVHEKKSMMEKIKDKLSGHHNH